MVKEFVKSVNEYEVENRLPGEVSMLMSALDAGASPTRDRRAGRRHFLRTKAVLRLFSDHPSAAPWSIYTRDVNSRSMGFLSPQRMPLGHGGVVELQTPNGPQNFHCTLLRCREFAPGWYEGAIYFNREQPQFNRKA